MVTGRRAGRGYVASSKVATTRRGSRASRAEVGIVGLPRSYQDHVLLRSFFVVAPQ